MNKVTVFLKSGVIAIFEAGEADRTGEGAIVLFDGPVGSNPVARFEKEDFAGICFGPCAAFNLSPSTCSEETHPPERTVPAPSSQTEPPSDAPKDSGAI